ncbi:conserved hypothetical protein [Trichinella spiralis]|uniref:hypothetical protein n=1 Tax=Trichinella spiralis TaxID=6334 RepID=UPI0001EFDB1C|nr:conserved hypothetical protein [Trichinella spiralis]
MCISTPRGTVSLVVGWKARRDFSHINVMVKRIEKLGAVDDVSLSQLILALHSHKPEELMENKMVSDSEFGNRIGCEQSSQEKHFTSITCRLNAPVPKNCSEKRGILLCVESCSNESVCLMGEEVSVKNIAKVEVHVKLGKLIESQWYRICLM